MNPELRRNLWLQFSPLRLVIAPLAVGIVLLLVWLITDHSHDLVAYAAEWYFLILVLFWGTRRAADLVVEEVAIGTWDSQRMSALGAWQMSWGKFIGGISYVWYSAAFAFLARLWVQSTGGVQPWHGDAGIQNLHILGIGLFGQAVSFLTSLVLLRKQLRRRRLGVTLSQFAGLAASIVIPGHLDIGIFSHELPDIGWYGHDYPGPAFALVTLALFLGWAIFGAYRLMRIELQFRCVPWAWLAFALFVMIYADGLLYSVIQTAHHGFLAWCALPFVLAHSMTYAAVFLEPKDVVRYRAFGAAASQGRLFRAITLLPQWIPIFLVTLGLGVGLSLFGDLDQLMDLPPAAAPGSGLWLLDMNSVVTIRGLPFVLVVYVLRDLLLVLFLNFRSRRGRADIMAFIWLSLAYFPAYGVLAQLNAGWVIAVLAPYPPAPALFSIAVAGFECAILAVFVLRRIRGAGQFRPAAA
jgi:hypothetical protein